MRAFLGLRTVLPSAADLFSSSLFFAHFLGALFYSEYFETRERFPWLQKLIEGLIALLVLGFAMTFSKSAAPIGNLLQSVAILALLFAPIVLSVLAIRRWKSPSAKIFLAGWSVYVVSILFWFSSELGCPSERGVPFAWGNRRRSRL